MSEEKDLLISAGHDYDGIREYDNPLPRWWVYLFYFTIITSCWYCGYYFAVESQVSDVSGDHARLAWSVGRLNIESEKQNAELKQAEGLKSESLSDYLADPVAIENGKNLYMTNCIACHGMEGQGIVGPNLTDAYWIHGYAPEDIRKSIAMGFPEKGMVSWEAMLGPVKVNELTAYIMSLEGKVVENPKAPEGEKKGS